MRNLASIASLFVLAALSGCGGVATSEPPQAVQEDPNRFQYQTVDYPYAVHFPAAGDTLSAPEMTRLQSFLKSVSARPEDKVTVSGDNSVLGQSRSARVRDVLSRAGLVTAPGVDVNLAPNTVALVLSETVAIAPHCGDWPIFAGDAPSNAPSLYLGCALRNNLYRQVVDKRDLAVGQTPGPADAEPGMRAVQKYREGTGDKSKNDSPADNNAAADSATGAAQGASSLTNSLSSTGNGNGQ